MADGMRSPWIRRTFDGLVDGFSVLGSGRLEQQWGAAAAAARCAVVATGGGARSMRIQIVGRERGE